MEYALRVEGLGKLYAINRGGSPAAGSIREQLGRSIDRLFGREHDSAMALAEAEAAATRQKEFWALKGVSFDVQAGERIGIIGANGAGKSTLLKILSRVTSPTEGRVEIRGKVASLLEVGTGFHPELTGRENIFLNGAILGMPRTEIRKKFDQIVDFSGVEKFIDTPVKHYSSGMYVRLAFSVSAWLDPDILILDEVLAVGDQSFQKKCEIRMRELTREGRTVLFVSHSMSTINQMCQKALYLEHGQVMSYGPVVDMTREYNRDVIEQIETAQIEALGAEWRWHRARFELPDKRIEVLTDHPGAVECLGGVATSPSGEVTEIIPINRPTQFTVRYRVTRDLKRPLVPTFNFYDEVGAILFAALPEKPMPGAAGDYAVTCELPAFLLNSGRFTINANLSDFHEERTTYFGVVSAFRIEIEEASDDVDPRRHGFRAPLPGNFRLRLRIAPVEGSQAVSDTGLRAEQG
ncbi:MAG: ABC transporter ATP-binding protein [Chelatococcus sp.]|nr:MAG: ABC transporter ATP-binding protein [Chelatococcus sp.]